MSAFRILLVEDNPGDVFLIREALREIAIVYELTLAKDGEQAIRELDRLAAGDGTDCPHLIVLDLNLPNINGLQVLDSIKRHPYCRHTPVAVLTSSDSPIDRLRVAELGADCFLRKPAEYTKFIAIGAELKKLLPNAGS